MFESNETILDGFSGKDCWRIRLTNQSARRLILVSLLSVSLCNEINSTGGDFDENREKE
jgi:hypothetical protein